jgi:hypothetical protein
MKISAGLSSARQSHWYDYGIRFLFGGIITVATGEIARRFGFTLAGLFLAFPAIFPASATLIEKCEREEKERAGMHGTRRGRMVASVDAAGAAIGSLGLIVFGAYVWKMLPRQSAAITLSIATMLWFGISVWLWTLRKCIRK